MGARAEILAWDSYLESTKDERRGRTVFKDDMLAKVYGGFVHESIGTHQDNQVALVLYKDAKEILLKNYSAYKTFNSKSVQFKTDFDKFPLMNLDEVKRNYVESTPIKDDLEKFLDDKITKLSPAKNNQKNQKQKNDNVGVVLQLGLIPEKFADKYNIGLEGALNQAPDSATKEAILKVGVPVISLFASQILGLTPDEKNWSPPGAMLGVAVANAAVSTVGISFELPKVVSPPIKEKTILEIYDSKNQSKVMEGPLVLLDPLGDIAEEAIAEESAWNYTRLGSRLVLKHATAILAAYSTYKLLSKGDNGMADFMARNVAVVEYMAASKAIEVSEKADVRYWSTLPRDVRMMHFFLPKGEYLLKAKIVESENSKLVDLGTIKIEDENIKQLFNFRLNKI